MNASTVERDVTADVVLGTRVRFTKALAGFRVRIGHDWRDARTADPLPDTAVDAHHLHLKILDRHRDETSGPHSPHGKRGTFRYVAIVDVEERAKYMLPSEGIIVGKTFRNQGEVDFDTDDGYHHFMCGMSPNSSRIPCWQVKQTMHRRPILVPIDAVQIIEAVAS